MMNSTDHSMEQMVGGEGEEEVVGVELEVGGLRAAEELPGGVGAGLQWWWSGVCG